MKYLEIKNIKKKFTNKNVLNNIDYKFSTGTIYALLGENGAGKTTLVSIISGIKKATEGQIIINEKIFEKGFNSCINIFKYTLITKSITLISTYSNNYGGDSNSINPSISYDGRYISFQSTSTNLGIKSYKYNT